MRLVRACVAMASYREPRHPYPYLVVVERSSLISVLASRLPRRATLRTGCTVNGLHREDGRVCGVRYAESGSRGHRSPRLPQIPA